MVESDQQAVAARLLYVLHAVFLSQLGTAGTYVLAVVCARHVCTVCGIPGQHPWVCCFAAPAAVYMSMHVSVHMATLCLAAMMPLGRGTSDLVPLRLPGTAYCGDLVAVVLCWPTPTHPCSRLAHRAYSLDLYQELFLHVSLYATC